MHNIAATEVSDKHQELSGAESPMPTSRKSKALELAEGLLNTGVDAMDDVQEHLVSLPVDKPNTSQFFRVHPDLHADIYLLKQKQPGSYKEEKYAVMPDLVENVDNVRLYTLFFGVHRDGSYFLWPVSASSADGYTRSARQIAIKAMKQWCRIVSQPTTANYTSRIARNCTDEPVWPEDKTIAELIALAFGDGHIIDSMDHPVVKEMWL